MIEKTIHQLFESQAQNIICLSNGRQIGALKDIEMQYYDENDKTIKWGDVQFIERHKVDKDMYNIILENGQFVKVTQDHSLMVLNNEGKLEECKAIDIKVGNEFITLTGNSKVKSITKQKPSNNWVYDIQMKDNPHTFFCNGILVHNSVFLRVSQTKDKLLAWLKNYNENSLLNDLIKECNPYINPDYYQYDLEYQKDLDYLYLGDRKKRYYSIQANGKKYIHGLNIIKKDTPKYIKELLDNICQKSVKQVLSVKDLEETFELLKRAKYEDIAVHKSFSKKFQAYNKTMPQHVSGALFANNYLDLKIRHSDVVFLFYINSFCEPQIKPQDRKNVICLRSQDFDVIKTSDKFEIDYVQLMQKQIIQPLREFDKISVVKKAINDWCSKLPENYRSNKYNEYVFKKKKI